MDCPVISDFLSSDSHSMEWILRTVILIIITNCACSITIDNIRVPYIIYGITNFTNEALII